jgi:hypothetical protein
MFALVVVGVLIFIFVAWYFSKDARIKRALRKAPIMKVGDFTDGAVGRITGKVRMLEEFKAPISGRLCAHFQAKVQQRRQSGKSSHWRTIIEESDMVDFVVEDESGRAMVEAAGAEVAVVKDAHFRSGTFNDATPELEAFLQRHGKSSTGLFGFNKTLRYTEGIIEEGEEVAVYGRGRWEKPAGGGSRQLVIGAPPEGNVLISDDPSTLT